MTRSTGHLRLPTQRQRTFIMKSFFSLVSFAALSLGDGHSPVHAETGLPAEIQAVLNQRCVECHNASEHQADIDFTSIKSAQDLDRNHRWWPRVLKEVSEGEMPPEDATSLTKAEKEQLIHWAANLIRTQQSQSANDPGVIPLRRLTAAEYQYTLRDIAGKSIDVARFLPSDQSTTHGFPNDAHGQDFSTEHLTMYLQAAKQAARHVHFLPYGGLTFAPHALLPGRDKQYSEYSETLRRHIEALAKKHGLGSEDGSAMLGRALFLCWEMKQQGAAGNERLQELCKAHNLNPRYLARIQENVLAPTESPWVRQLIQEPWKQLAQSPAESDEKIQRRCEQIAEAAFATLSSILDANLVGAGFPTAYAFELKDLETPSQDFLASRDGDELVTRCYIALTDAGTGIQNTKVFWARGRGRDDEELHKQAIDKYHVKEHSEEIDKQRREGVLLEVPGYYEFELRKPFEEEPGSEKKKTAYFKFEGNFRPVFENSEGAVQILYSGRPILDKHGTVSTKAPGRFELVPLTPDINKSIAHPRFVGLPSELSERHLKWHDEMAVNFLPQCLPQIFFFGADDKGKAGRRRWGVPLENAALTRSDAFESWLNLFIDDEERRKLDQQWLDASMATLDPWRRVQAMSRGFPELSEMSALEQDAYLKRQTQDHLKSYEAYSYRPTVPPNQRYQANLELCPQLDALAEPNIVTELMKFAERAWRRPLTENERQRVRDLYRSARAELDAQDAGRHVVASIVASPQFIFRPEISGSDQPTHPVPPAGLANRLSYLLWSSAPDDSLRELISGRQEVSGEMLFQEFQRMKKDQKVNRFVLEFFGQWFWFKGFDNYQMVDTQRFPEFTREIRGLMFRQSTDFFLDLIQQDRPVTDIILGTEIPNNPRFAHHSRLDYQQIKWFPDEEGNMPKIPAKAEDFRDPKRDKSDDQRLYRADVSSALEARGVWALSSTLTLTSKMVRTDPIRRGVWFYETLLGRHLPPPPENVGMLPEDEKQDDGLTLRQRLEKHRSQASCAACHAKFDPFGLALEGFDAIGRVRQEAAAGLQLDTSFEMEEIKGSGAAAIQTYLEHNQEEFLRHFSRRLIAYALGREALPSDQELIDRMIENGKQHEHRFSSYFRTLLESRQFQYRRGMPIVASE